MRLLPAALIAVMAFVLPAPAMAQSAPPPCTITQGAGIITVNCPNTYQVDNSPVQQYYKVANKQGAAENTVIEYAPAGTPGFNVIQATVRPRDNPRAAPVAIIMSRTVQCPLGVEVDENRVAACVQPQAAPTVAQDKQPARPAGSALAPTTPDGQPIYFDDSQKPVTTEDRFQGAIVSPARARALKKWKVDRYNALNNNGGNGNNGGGAPNGGGGNNTGGTTTP